MSSGDGQRRVRMDTSVPRSDIHDIRSLTDTGPITLPSSGPRVLSPGERPATA